MATSFVSLPLGTKFPHTCQEKPLLHLTEENFVPSLRSCSKLGRKNSVQHLQPTHESSVG